MKSLTDREQAEVAVIAAAVVRKFGDTDEWTVIRELTHEHYGHLHLGNRCFGRVVGYDGISGGNGRDGRDGVDGIDGKDGVDGKDGTNGIDGRDGRDGIDGINGIDGLNGRDGVDGKDGESIKGDKGEDGRDGIDGINGRDGVDGNNGTNGTNGVDGINGVNGANGLSAYQIAVSRGFVGTEAQWLASLKPTTYATRVTTVAATGLATWTFPTPFPAGVIPVISATAQQVSGVIAEVQIASVDNTQCTVLVTRTAAITVTLLNLTILQIAAAASTVVHVTATMPS